MAKIQTNFESSKFSGSYLLFVRNEKAARPARDVTLHLTPYISIFHYSEVEVKVGMRKKVLLYLYILYIYYNIYIIYIN